MISADSLSIEWMSSKIREFKGDPIIVEKVIQALTLLESLRIENLEFIFKGGTALMLMIQEPRRFSIDIDILIENKDQDLEQILNVIIDKTVFVKWEEHKRKTVSEIEKRHFKLFYEPLVKMRGDLNYILLDVVYETNPYVNIQETNISHFLLIEEGSPIQVITPTLEAILGDKLTAYGPNTTGVPLTKPMEVMKQIYDIAGIFDRISSLETVKQNFIKVAQRELAYRGFESTDHKVIFDDIINTSHNFCVYGRLDKKTFAIMRSGVSRLNNFIYGEKFREPQAQIAVAKAAYLSSKLDADSFNLETFDKSIDMNDWAISDHHFSALNKLKKHNLEAFYYWYKVFKF
ncbi:nucleotidyl transferase AbiEii/AbiGii toxin family protein [Aquimarina macrocephali]|uniref:nucleotidyl transferase AbiEii/AbiGii toxin family protein n=1 Tax=Aquimarina macrocephali TaxID=666563 RepID=UPI00046558C7|nr:nucleotidyl transferase AbiEii/AbiGii toxin family protein [Aquimarina macrocephali]